MALPQTQIYLNYLSSIMGILQCLIGLAMFDQTKKGITHTPLEQSHFNTWNKDRDYFD